MAWMSMPVFAESTQPEDSKETSVATQDVIVEADKAKEAAKYESQSTTIITAEDIAKTQAKSVEDIIFTETGVTRTVDAMGRVGVSIRGAEPRHTLIMVDGQPVMGDIAKYSGAGDELQRIGAENIDHIEIIRGSASAKYGSDAIGGVINVVMKKPAKTAGMEVNIEGMRTKGNSDTFPYTNSYIRADSGQVGKWRFAAYGSKRDILPIYRTFTDSTMNTSRFAKDSLRYYGDIKNIGAMASVDIDERNSIDVTVDSIKEDLKRNNRGTLMQFKRKVNRDSQQISYTGNNGGNTDWKFDYSYSKLQEDDITLSSMESASKYEGKNTLAAVDNVLHKQWTFKGVANTQVNDEHLLTYGFGYSQEDASGSRIRTPNSELRKINPWDYDKTLRVPEDSTEPSSSVHAYTFTYVDGIPQYDADWENYGVRDSNGQVLKPAFTYQDWIRTEQGRTTTDEDKAKMKVFADQLRKENSKFSWITNNMLVINSYYQQGFMMGQSTWNGREFREEYKLHNNQQFVGKAKIKKQNIFVQDTWQLNDRTILAPILRVDHSDLFGSNATFNIGLTHNLNGNANRRFKANIGTGYAEPGIGELYYNWEMYGGMPIGDFVSQMGYWFAGNPNLKPEKSVNFDLGIEGENNNTTWRASIFHNNIKDYMTTYFTGKLMDFHSGDALAEWINPPDMIYSFKNIGKAEITGLEAKVTHNFNDHWSASLGYTYLNTQNKSDPTLPDQLLDRPQHKVDIGVNYENKKGGWRASLWGNYYIHMLDSNAVLNTVDKYGYSGNYITIQNGYTGEYQTHFKEGDIQYQKKSYGIWNFLIQKDLSKDSMVYFGIDNIFNHHDDDRALQERVYKAGLNMKFGPDTKTIIHERAAKEAGIKAPTYRNNWFLTKDFDTQKAEGVQVIGDYRARWNSFTGKDVPSEERLTPTTSIGSAAKNVLQQPAHGFEQRLRLGIDARLGDNTNVTILGSAAGMPGVDTKWDSSDSRGLNKQRLETVNVTQHANTWDFSLGRLTERMGVTGYWFGKEYDGARAVWTSGKNQLRFGYGDFSQSTGIQDSAYTHATRQTFWRAPTKDEWIQGSADGYEGLRQKLAQAKSLEEEKQILDTYLDVIKKDDPKTYDKVMAVGPGLNSTLRLDTYAWKKITIKDKAGNVVGEYIAQVGSGDLSADGKQPVFADMFNKDKLQELANKIWYGPQDSFPQTPDKKLGGTEAYITKLQQAGPDGIRVGTTGSHGLGDTIYESWYGYGSYSGNPEFLHYTNDNQSNAVGIQRDRFDTSKFTTISAEEAKEKALSSLWSWDGSAGIHYGDYSAIGNSSTRALPQNLRDIFNWAMTWEPEDKTKNPLHLLEQLGYMRLVEGTVLVQDQIPSLKRAVFAQYKRQIGDTLGVQAWYLRSFDDSHSFVYANGRDNTGNSTVSFDKLANIVGFGAAWRPGDNIKISYDWGQNRTDFGRFMNGNTLYDPTAAVGSAASFLGRSNGGVPRFWTVRMDIGKADVNVPGSWNMFADYKYFQHGSFFGGNGTDSLPDRYLDGIKSFTVGGGYVPAKNLLVEAFYTFGAKSTNKRDTLYGAEAFDLGDYTRVQVSYRF